MKFFDLVAPIYGKIRPGAENIFQKLTSVAEFKSNDIVIDLGGGAGNLATFFVGKVQDIIVVDPSEQMIRQCGNHSGVSCMVGSGEKLPFADGVADKIILVDAFHHIQDQVKTIREIKRVLKPNGVVVFVEYNPATFGGKAVVIFEKIMRMGSTFYKPTDLASMFSKRGFKTTLFDESKKNYYLVAEKGV